jgi:hypothetical protein
MKVQAELSLVVDEIVNVGGNGLEQRQHCS